MTIWFTRRRKPILRFSRTSRDLSLSLSYSLLFPCALSLSLGIGNNTLAIYIPAEFRLSRNFISRCSTRSKCKLLPPPFLASCSWYFRFAQVKRVIRVHTRFFLAIWIYGSIEEEWRSIQTRCRSSSLFYYWISRAPRFTPSYLSGTSSRHIRF